MSEDRFCETETSLFMVLLSICQLYLVHQELQDVGGAVVRERNFALEHGDALNVVVDAVLAAPAR